MAAVQDSDTVVSPADARGRTSLAWLVLLMAAGGFALTVLVFHPGYVTVDARYVYADAQAWRFGDWQSPAMGVLWRLIDPIAPGSLSMFLLTVTLYWLGFGLLALIAVRRVGVARPGDAAARARPAGILLRRDGLARHPVRGRLARRRGARLRGREPAPRWRRLIQAFALLLVALGVLLRPNAIFAAPFLAAYVVWPLRFDVKRMAIVFRACRRSVRTRSSRSSTTACSTPSGRIRCIRSSSSISAASLTSPARISFPVTWSAEQTALLTSKCYDPVRWDTYWHVPPCPFVMQRLERPDDMIFGTPRLIEAWWRAVSTHPLAYLQPPRDLHVAVPRPLESRCCRSGIGRIPRELWPQSVFQAAGCAPRRAAADRCCSGPAFGWSLPSLIGGLGVAHAIDAGGRVCRRA